MNIIRFLITCFNSLHTKIKYTITAKIKARPPHDAIEIEISTALAVIGNFWMTGTKIPDMVGIGNCTSLKPTETFISQAA